MYYCYQHNWSSRYEQCPSCVTYKTTSSNNTCDVLLLNTPHEQSLNQIIADKNVIIDAAQAEIARLKAKLEKAIWQRNHFVFLYAGNRYNSESIIKETDKELDSITIDSIKRGEK